MRPNGGHKGYLEANQTPLKEHFETNQGPLKRYFEAIQGKPCCNLGAIRMPNGGCFEAVLRLFRDPFRGFVIATHKEFCKGK